MNLKAINKELERITEGYICIRVNEHGLSFICHPDSMACIPTKKLLQAADLIKRYKKDLINNN